MRKIYCLFILILVFTGSYGQSAHPNAPGRPLQDTARLHALLELSETLPAGQLQAVSEEIISRTAKLLAGELSPDLKKRYREYMLTAYYNLGSDLETQMKQQEALAVLEKGLDLARQFNDTEIRAYLLIRIADININLGKDYARISPMLYEALKIAQQAHDSIAEADVYMNLGSIHFPQKNFDKAMSAYVKAYDIYRGLKINTAMIKALQGIKNIYADQKQIPQMLLRLEEIRSLLHYPIDKQPLLPDQEIYYSSLGETCLYSARTDEAILNFKKSLSIIRSSNVRVPVTRLYRLLGNCYKQKKDYAMAIRYQEKALSVSHALHDKWEQSQALYGLYRLYQLSGDYKKALQMHESYQLLKDSLQQKENRGRIAEQQLKYEFEKKALLTKAAQQKQLATIQLTAEKSSARKNLWLLLLIACILLLVAGAYFLFKFFRQRNVIVVQANKLLQQKLLSSQMNPHFIFNSLNAIQNYIFRQNSLQAGTYLAQFADLMRMILDFSKCDYIKLEDELKFLRSYIELQQLRFENKFEYSLNIDEDLEPGSIMLPPMLAQPFIENAIEHGLAHKMQRGHIYIDLRRSGQQLMYTIEDDGIGLQASGELRQASGKKHISRATAITKERIEHLCAGDTTLAGIELVNREITEAGAGGVRVRFKIPYKENHYVESH